MNRTITNEEVALVLERVADLLEAQHTDGFRVRAWRRGAESCRESERPLGLILADEGMKGLEDLPGIGKSLASAIAEFLHAGRLRLLDRLEGEVSPEDLFTTVPGIGEVLARRIHETLGAESLEELEQAAHDGRLAQVPGFGERRARAVRDVLATLLSQSSRRRARRIRHAGQEACIPPPSVKTILAIDALYREKAEKGSLRRIAPRRFNPGGEAWLPILHATRDGWFFTAMYSNTARAHALGMTRDWVVVFYECDGHEEQCTVVTERRGPLAGQRVVRGREQEHLQVDGEGAAGAGSAAG